MSDDWDEDTGESDIRRRAAWLLGMLALVAVLFVALLVFLTGGPGTKKTPAAAPYPTATATPTSAPAHSSSSRPSRHPTRSSTVSRSHRPGSCPTQDPCVIAGDAGNVVAAINAYRRSNGASPVSGSVTKEAQTCAVSNGDSCPSSYFWEPVAGQSGTEVVNKIAGGGGDGERFLLGTGVRTFEVGWAFVPSTRSYACAVISR